ncbi:exosortase [Alkalimonas mucilaginosa]|uniref:Exosortase n=1 Tax=Alkalimonas mucilaginosa TaxID=3057676 RepID=A0ABU7JB24_9GAMM|nr:exosortase [Alkalimonas sp. MEB004]MEE2022889.1 exosortase [Alkalimonas sp. MEB004]
MVQKETSNSAPQAFAVLIPAICIFLLFFLVNPTILADFRTYSFDDGTYSHAYLIPFVIAYLYWRAWKQQQLVLSWNSVFFALFISSLFVFLLLQLAQQNIVSRLLLPLVLIFALLSLYRRNSSVIVPAALVWFITPIWGAINGILQKISVLAVTEIMRWTHVPTFVDGNFIHIPAGTFEIADGCSGLRYFIVSLALSVIFSFLNLKRARSILLFFTVAILGSLITNWIRIVLLILIGDYTEMQSSLMEDHNTFGWYLYVPFIALLFYFGSFLDRDKALQPSPQAASTLTLQRGHYVLLFTPLLVLSTLMVNLVTQSSPLYSVAAIDVTAEPQSHSFKTISPQIFVADHHVHKEQQAGLHKVFFQHYSFSGSDDARRSNYYLNNMLPAGWRQQKLMATAEGAWLWAQAPSGQTGLIYYWHQIGNQRTVSGLKMRLYRLQQALWLNQETELYWYFIYCDNDQCVTEQQILSQLIQS